MLPWALESSPVLTTRLLPQAGCLKKGMHCVIKGKPCKIIEYTTSKTGKHGHAKAKIVAVDIFTDVKLEEICPTSHNMYAPNVTRTDYTLIDIQGDFLTCQDKEGEMREDLTIPLKDEVRKMLFVKWEKSQKTGTDVLLQVTKAIGEEHAMVVKDGTT